MSLREKTRTEYRQRLNTVILYIQEHLDEALTIEKLADLAYLSPFHFHRIFSAHFNESIHSYIKRIRLERAAMMIQTTHRSITEVAIISGYQTASAFTKAFRKHFGQSPKGFRQIPEGVVACQRDIPVSIGKIQDQQVIFVREIGNYQQAAGNAWKSLFESIGYQNIDYQTQKAIGITYDSPEITNEQFIRYDACLTVGESEELVAEGIVGRQRIAGGRYAIFTHTGPYDGLDEVYSYIYREWLPQSGYELRDSPSFCHYHQIDPSSVEPDELVTDIYMPLLD